jgi:hypothetical protein
MHRNTGLQMSIPTHFYGEYNFFPISTSAFFWAQPKQNGCGVEAEQVTRGPSMSQKQHALPLIFRMTMCVRTTPLQRAVTGSVVSYCRALAPNFQPSDGFGYPQARLIGDAFRFDNRRAHSQTYNWRSFYCEGKISDSERDQDRIGSP